MSINSALQYRPALIVSPVASIRKWFTRFAGGFIIWLLAIAFGLVALKGNMQGFASRAWWHETGTVYLLWGFLNYLIFFGLIHFIVPYGVGSRKYARMIGYTVLLILVVGLIKYYFVNLKRFDYVLVSYYKDGNENQPVYFNFRQYIQKTFFTGTFVACLGYAWGLMANWVKGEKQRKELENKQLSAELSFLRMQLTPHFLFNSLNSIYSLSLKKSDAAPEAILKLSEMMRHMLYQKEDADHMVTLESEVAYLHNYIGLQRIRYKNSIFIDVLTEGDMEDKRIAPLLLIPFVENGFKHGVLQNESHPLQVQLVVENSRLIFNVKNMKNLDNKDFSGGIGMDNVKRRLALLYPGSHQLTITDGEEFYKSELVLLLY